ncbi:MAG TPA: HEAT repeat domain-containing protein [Gemmataceae bacterium]|nr:HEAT repeat domain-containing protein [Gemmataceae bacterium]
MRIMTRHVLMGLGLLFLTAPIAQAAPTDEQIKRAISDARSYLQATFRAGTPAPNPVAAGPGIKGGTEGGIEGAAALAGIAMMEAGVSPDDPTIVAIARVVREAIVDQAATYNLALDLIFLEKLDEPADLPLIQAAGIRLLAGQNANGAWTYSCPIPSQQEAEQLKQAATAGNKAAPKKDAKDSGDGDPSNGRPALAPAADAIRNRLVNNMKTGANFQGVDAGAEDNSNTQFAVLGLWAARRSGVPVEKALELAEARFRRTQGGDGGWNYTGGNTASTPSMTCAGLLALAAGRGVHTERLRIMRAGGAAAPENPQAKKENKGNAPPVFRPLEDKQIVAGLNFVGNAISMDAQGLMPGMPGMRLPPNGAPQMAAMLANQMMRNDYYCLWSIERVGMIFGVNKLGQHDWYAWGSTHIIAKQGKDGSWSGKYGPHIDTSFGLMFLCRANLVKDLSDLMGNRVMKMGGAKKQPAGGASTEGPKIVQGTTPASAPAAAESEAQKLAKALLEATGAKQLELIKEYAAAKGASYTEAFVEAIPQLPDNSKKTARDCFAERMSRMSANTLKSRLQDKSPEMRRAAVLAVAMREEKELIPDVIASLEDPEELVSRAAHLALRSFSGKDLGPAAGASADEKAKAAAAWKDWAKTQK